MTVAALLVSVGVGAFAIVEDTPKAPLVPIAGTVVVADRRPAAGAGVHIRVQEQDDTGQVCGNAPIEVRGAYVIHTKDSGWFRTPMILDPQLHYAALVEADGYELAHTGWAAGKARTFPEVVLRPRAILDPAAVVGSVVHVDPIRRATP